MARKFDLITELYAQTVKRVMAPRVWQEFLSAACRNYKLSFDEQLLVFAQRPDATAVLEIERWNKQFGRRVNAGATGIAVIDGDHIGQARLKYYFDVSDTHEGRYPRRVPIWIVQPEHEPEITEALENSFGELESKDFFAQALLSAARNAVADNMQDYLSELHPVTGNSFLEELDDFNVEVTFRNALQSSVGYMLLSRCGLDASEYLDDDDFRDIVNFSTPETLNILGTATGDIGQMCLSEIARTVLNLQKQAEKQIAHLQNCPFGIILSPIRQISSQKGALTMTEMTYTMIGGYRLPNLLPPQEPEIHLGKYALLRLTFLKNHRRGTFTNLLTSGMLNQHLMEIDKTARSQIEQMMAEMAMAEGVTEELKATNQMKWVGLMNNIRHSAEETVLAELIYA